MEKITKRNVFYFPNVLKAKIKKPKLTRGTIRQKLPKKLNDNKNGSRTKVGRMKKKKKKR